MSRTSAGVSLAKLRDGLQGTSAVMLKMYLRYRGLTAGMNDPKDKVVRRIERYVAEGDLDADELAVDILRFREHNNKRVYLYNVTPAALANFQPKKLPGYVADVSGVSLSRSPSSPTLIYSYLEIDEARAVFAETHRRAVPDYARGIIRSEDVGKIVVLTAELTTGFITLSYDAPEIINPHGSQLAYYRYYRDKAEELLGTPILEFQIGGALLRLERSPLVHIPEGRQMVNGGHLDVKSDGDDYRELGTYAKFAADVIGHDRGRYIWLADDTGKKKAVPSFFETSPRRCSPEPA